jgi:hypothetical protein
MALHMYKGGCEVSDDMVGALRGDKGRGRYSFPPLLTFQQHNPLYIERTILVNDFAMALTQMSNAISQYTGLSRQSAPSAPSAIGLPDTSLADYEAERPVNDIGSSAPPLSLAAPEAPQAIGWVEEASVDSNDPDRPGPQSMIQYNQTPESRIDGSTSVSSDGNLRSTTSQLAGTGGKLGARMLDWTHATADGGADEDSYGPLAIIDRDTQAPVDGARTTNSDAAQVLLLDPPTLEGEADEAAKLSASDRMAAITERIKADERAGLRAHQNTPQTNGWLRSKEHGSRDTVDTVISFEDVGPQLHKSISSQMERPRQAFPSQRAPSDDSGSSLSKSDMTFFSAHKNPPAHGDSHTRALKEAHDSRYRSMQPSRSLVTERTYADRKAMTKNTRFPSLNPTLGHRDPDFEAKRDYWKTLRRLGHDGVNETHDNQQELFDTVLSAIGDPLRKYIAARVDAGIQSALQNSMYQQPARPLTQVPFAFPAFPRHFGDAFTQVSALHQPAPSIHVTILSGGPGANQPFHTGRQSEAHSNVGYGFGYGSGYGGHTAGWSPSEGSRYPATSGRRHVPRSLHPARQSALQQSLSSQWLAPRLSHAARHRVYNDSYGGMTGHSFAPGLSYHLPMLTGY